jgi:hypothetical protein
MMPKPLCMVRFDAAMLELIWMALSFLDASMIQGFFDHPPLQYPTRFPLVEKVGICGCKSVLFL